MPAIRLYLHLCDSTDGCSDVGVQRRSRLKTQERKKPVILVNVLNLNYLGITNVENSSDSCENFIEILIFNFNKFLTRVLCVR